MEKPSFSRRDLLKGFVAGSLLAGGAEALRRMGTETKKTQEQSEDEDQFVPVERNDFFDGNPEYLQSLTPTHGEWTKAQRAKRRRQMSNGEDLFQDVGLTFYLVRKGDTISDIRKRLAVYPEFAHLAQQTGKLDSFNIPAKKLRSDLWIPIPIETADRHLSEAQFIAYASAAIAQMREDARYGPEVERILARTSMRDFMATILAVAKQEGGGKPLGQFELHRWEAHQRAFSFSYFHVLMKGPGLRARRSLNLTEGQLYHPQNAVKLFLAFLVEKNAEVLRRADRLFPVWENPELFAKFYNGSRWKKTNPQYLVNLRRYYDEADAFLSQDGQRWLKESRKKVEVF